MFTLYEHQLLPMPSHSDIHGSYFLLPGYYVPAPRVFCFLKLCLILHSLSGVNSQPPLQCSNFRILSFYGLEKNHKTKIIRIDFLKYALQNTRTGDSPQKKSS